MSYIVNFNKAVYAGKTKAEFIEAEKHHSDKVDLNAEFDKMFPPEIKKATSKEVAKDKTD